MSSTNIPPAFGEGPRAYGKKEREVMDVHKTEYMNTTTPAERLAIAKGKIFPDLFTYWSSIGEDLNPSEQDRRTDVSRFINQCLYL